MNYVRRPQVEVVKSLLAHKASPKAGAMDDMLPLHFAAQKGHTEVARLLINDGALRHCAPGGLAKQGHVVCYCIPIEVSPRRRSTQTSAACSATSVRAGLRCTW